MYEEYSKPIYGVTIGKFKNEDGTYRKEYWTDNIVSTRVSVSYTHLESCHFIELWIQRVIGADVESAGQVVHG